MTKKHHRIQHSITNPETGEIEDSHTTHIETEHAIAIITRHHRHVPTQPFVFATQNTMHNLTDTELVIFVRLWDYLNYENNFLYHPNTHLPLTINDIAELTGRTREHISRKLKSLQRKHYLTIVPIGNARYVWLSSEYVWKGRLQSRNDSLLHLVQRTQENP